ncbi:MAG: hypothetical protein ACRDDA_12730 [Aeromonas sp.]
MRFTGKSAHPNRSPWCAAIYTAIYTVIGSTTDITVGSNMRLLLASALISLQAQPRA